MIEVIEYEVQENNVTAGFKKHDFIVYGSIGKELVEGLTRNQILQKLYEQCKHSIDYETERYNQGLSNSIITDKTGERFVPEEPKPSKLKVNFDNLTGAVLDQYGDICSEEDIEFTIEGTDKARIEDNIIVEGITEEDEEYFIVARWGDLEEKQKRIIYALEPDRIKDLRNEVYEELSKVNKMENHVLEVQNYIVEKEYQELLEKGGL